jgi:hypothetical protein
LRSRSSAAACSRCRRTRAASRPSPGSAPELGAGLGAGVLVDAGEMPEEGVSLLEVFLEPKT